MEELLEFDVGDYVKVNYPEGSYLKSLSRNLNTSPNAGSEYCVYGVYDNEVHKISKIIHTKESVVQNTPLNGKDKIHPIYSYANFVDIDKVTLLGVPFKYIRHLTKQERNILIAEKEYNL